MLWGWRGVLKKLKCFEKGEMFSQVLNATWKKTRYDPCWFVTEWGKHRVKARNHCKHRSRADALCFISN